jgi:hypothetical protein
LEQKKRTGGKVQPTRFNPGGINENDPYSDQAEIADHHEDLKIHVTGYEIIEKSHQAQKDEFMVSVGGENQVNSIPAVLRIQKRIQKVQDIIVIIGERNIDSVFVNRPEKDPDQKGYD